MPTTTQPRRLIRRFGTARRWRSEGPGRYVALTPLGVPLTRDGGQPIAVERRRADRSRSLHAGWYVVTPWWPDLRAYETAREAAQQAQAAVREHDTSDRLAKP